MSSRFGDFTERAARVGVVALVCATTSWLACADFSRGSAPVLPDGGGGAGGAASDAGAGASFADEVHGLLISGCQRCHSSDGEASDTKFLLTGDAASDYTSAVMFVSTDAPSSSRMLAKMSGNGHQGGKVYGADTPEYATILQWIQEGARP